MNEIHILIVENNKDLAEEYEEGLGYAFRDSGIPVNWLRARDLSSARQLVRETDRIDVAIVDLYLRDQSRQVETQKRLDSITVINDMRKWHAGAYVLLVTNKPGWIQGFGSKYMNLADRALSRSEIDEGSDWSWGALGEDIKEHLIQSRRLSIANLGYDSEDVAVVSMLEEVGQALSKPGGHEEGAYALWILAYKCLGKLVPVESRMEILYLNSGRSGAKVCQLNFFSHGNREQSFVLKFGFDSVALEHEHARNGEAIKILGKAALMQVEGVVGSHARGYHAIAANVAARATPLGKWLRENASVGDARIAARILLCDHLKPLFHKDEEPDIPTSKWIGMGPGHRLRALAAINRYESALEDRRAGAVEGGPGLIEDMRRFINGDMKTVGCTSDMTSSMVMKFGDLHSGNVLVRQWSVPSPVLIDAAMYGKGHWGDDHARLLADLVLRVRTPGVESMLWSAVQEADHVLQHLCPHCRSDSGFQGASEDPVCAFIDQAVQGLIESTHMSDLNVAATAWHWEWHVALGREFIRHATYEDVTPPRACLALVVAGNNLLLARRLSGIS